MIREALVAGCEAACHGCRHRSLTAEASSAQKGAYLARALRPWADRLSAVVTAAPGRRYGYRDRVTLTVHWSPDAGWQFGLMRRDELIPIPDCPIHTERVRALVQALRDTLPPRHQLPLAYLHVAGAQATLIVKARSSELGLLAPVLPAVAACGIEGLWLHFHPSAGRRLFARSGWRLLHGVRESRGPEGLMHGPTAFMQALPELHRRAVEHAAAHLAPGAGVSVLDLYCGLGATLREWTRLGSPALGVELSGEAVSYAMKNAPLATVLRGTCMQRLPQIQSWWVQREGERVVYVNPPRSGLESEVIRSLADELRPTRLAYLSCSAGTLARDLGQLQGAGYSVTGITPYDFFPNTHHVEALALAVRD